VIINTGDGKGKTTAALGTALRAAGHGHRVAIVQFLKGEWNYGEARALARFENVELIRIGSGFTWQAEDPAVPHNLAREAWAIAWDRVTSGRYDLVILDELNYVLGEGYVTVQEVLALLAARPAPVSIIITGRGAPQELVDVADTVTEMHCVKHPFTEGTAAQKGIEY